MVSGESFFLSVQKKDLRISRDWVGDRWVDIEAKSDILSVITEAISAENKASLSAIAKDDKSEGVDMSNTEVSTSNKLNTIKEEKPDLANSVGSDTTPEEIALVNEKKTSALDDKGHDENHNNNGNNGDGSSEKLDAEATLTSEHDSKTSETLEVTEQDRKTLEPMEVMT